MDWDAIRDRKIAQEGERLLAEGLVDSLPEDVQFQRYIDPTEYAQVYVDCLREQGFDAKVSGPSGFSLGEVPESQAAMLNEAMYRCEVMYPVHPRFGGPLDERQLGVLYDYLTTSLVDCLRSHGYRVEEPPSRQAFIESYGAPSGEVPRWHPYNSLEGLSEDEWQRVNGSCPPDPPLEDLFGSA